MNVIINGETVAFTKFNPLHVGHTNNYYCDVGRRYFLKKSNTKSIECEVRALTLLSKYERHFPTLVSYTSDYVITKFIVGELLVPKKAPINVREQVENILTILEKERLCHNDIGIQQFIVSNGNLILTDFENSFLYESPSPPPHGLRQFRLRRWLSKNPDYSTNNRKRMMYTLRSFF
jgi:hypothetical protein